MPPKKSTTREAQGHEAKVSELYAMHWRRQIDRDDLPKLSADARLRIAYASGEATFSDTLTEDLKRGQ
ncbi:hypothetical protein UCDDA912_g07205 [Diaporthe ampelina]|uniref:Uncharacterized protein n=1 Tax=Diaporthe ampelina TaxID=1214573 RepID=A0A0G2HXZ3_9PEZI|nr:hypothetical protein UCDDA912_g07205 [Diaporthe ampelina]